MYFYFYFYSLLLFINIIFLRNVELPPWYIQNKTRLLISQLVPENESKHAHVKEFPFLVHVPAFWHGIEAQGSTILEQVQVMIEQHIIWQVITTLNTIYKLWCAIKIILNIIYKIRNDSYTVIFNKKDHHVHHWTTNIMCKIIKLNILLL